MVSAACDVEALAGSLADLAISPDAADVPSAEEFKQVKSLLANGFPSLATVGRGRESTRLATSDLEDPCEDLEASAKAFSGRLRHATGVHLCVSREAGSLILLAIRYVVSTIPVQPDSNSLLRILTNPTTLRFDRTCQIADLCQLQMTEHWEIQGQLLGGLKCSEVT
jgi:hypothetical protein